MGWRSAHGANRKAVVAIEPLPADELPHTKPGAVRRGGATKIKLSKGLTITAVADDWKPYVALAEQFRLHHCRELARQAGGFLGAAPSSMVASASLQLAMSRYMFDKGCAEGDMALLKTASSILNDSRQNLLAAFELAIRECEARAKYQKDDPHRALSEALALPLPGEESTLLPKKRGRPRKTPLDVEASQDSVVVDDVPGIDQPEDEQGTGEE